MKTINLLPKEVKVKDVKGIIFNILLILFIAVTVLLVGYLLFLFNVNSNLVPKFEEYSAVNNQMDTYINELETYERFKNRVEEKYNLVNTLQENEVIWSEILYELGEIMPKDAYIEYIDGDSKQLYEYIRKSDEEKKDDTEDKIFFIVSGHAASYSDVTRLKIEIEGFPHAGSVIINNIAKENLTDSNIEAVFFQITAYYDMSPYKPEITEPSETQAEETGEGNVLDSEIDIMEQQ